MDAWLRQPFDDTVIFVSGHAAFPQCIEAQYRLLNKFYHGKFRYIAYLDERLSQGIFTETDGDSVTQMQKKCEELGILCRVFPANLHELRTFLHPATEDLKDSYSLHPSDLIQWAFQESLCHNGVFVNMDADLLLVKHTNLNDLMKGKAFRWMQQVRKCHIIKTDPEVPCEFHYAWNTLLAMNLSALPNLDEFSMDAGKVCVAEGCDAVDTGGKSQWFISSLPEEMKGRIEGEVPLKEEDAAMFTSIPSWRSAVFELIEDRWMHIRNGGHGDPANLNRYDNGRICEDLIEHFHLRPVKAGTV
uniref:Nucleotide-diphospho-sugar transferase domain-containing protein n=1 Tax=Chromera velia CCMP2878 TaxID=1169474 RepID=A0A0G4HMD1_9ALVE|eukprot:Cvel_29066.t1-p1 / transcript=Cvel_29066.t1 / gene=Cvel_29066 / organism=Chromera_velia_CCMP2878 / gene_product=hypothetical protein / transcript_product=hypothetical protein / location=Cvel_scaffold3919:4137-6349(-) / protein_length=301 / sequence_SO=supercontig / SO=protein_coding / is_pseudo=false